jgi:5-methylcytosine-specific restriction endonuclease McrA
MQMVLPILLSGQKQCLFTGCDLTHKMSYGYCLKHYLRIKRYDDLYVVERKTRRKLDLNNLPNTAGICSIENCGLAERLVRGWCMMHYLRWRKTGNPLTTIRQNKYAPNMKCIIEGCNGRRYVRDWCSKHYRAWYNHGDVLTPDKRLYPDPTPEEIERRRKLKILYTNRRRVMKLNARVYEYTQDALDARINYFGGKCWMCGNKYSDLDHIKPLSKGGKDCPSNLRPACKPCNSSKGAKWYGVAELHKFIKS